MYIHMHVYIYIYIYIRSHFGSVGFGSSAIADGRIGAMASGGAQTYTYTI